jgi:hypothetical protein
LAFDIFLPLSLGSLAAGTTLLLIQSTEHNPSPYL